MANITTYVVRPKFKDQNSPDGFFHRGFRKIRGNGDVGYVLAQGLKFGSKELLDHVGKWIYISVDYYWAMSALCGRNIFSDNNELFGDIKCDSI